MKCIQCGAELAEGTPFCGKCGTAQPASGASAGQAATGAPAGQSVASGPAAAASANQSQAGFVAPAAGGASQQSSNPQSQYQRPSYQQQQTYQQTGAPVSPLPTNKRLLAMLLYWSGLVGLVIALVVADKSDPFIKHHLNQMLVLFLGVLVGSFLMFIFIGFLIMLFCLVLQIMATVEAYHGTTKPMPLLGKIRIIK